MAAFVIAWACAMLGAVMIERLTGPRSPWLAVNRNALVFRAAAFTFIFFFFFAWSWRPAFAAVACCIFVAVFVAISVGKMRFVREPLVFSDMAFILDVFRHPKLFYSTFLGPLFLIGSIGSIIAIIVLWFRVEPPRVPAHQPELVIAGVLAAWLATAAGPFLPRLRHGYERWALSLKSEPEVWRDLAEHGLIATLVMDWLAWRGEDRRRRTGLWVPAHVPRTHDAAGAADLIVIAQCESFMDFRRFDSAGLSLPNLDAARRRAVAWGRLENAFAGGYTMRTEFSLLTGRPHRDFGFDRYYPYLNAGAYAEHALPLRLRRRGYATTFIHPYYPDFFQRHRALPAIGFDRMITLEAFDGAERVGGYVSDAAVAERVIAEAKAAKGRAFLFSATMENHGPWEKERFDGLDQPIPIYKRHLEHGDALLGRLMSTFDKWPGRVVLLFYGDHVPLLKAHADPFPDPSTDYVLLELGRGAVRRPPIPECRRAIHQLTWDVLRLAGLLTDVRRDAA
jgi:Sulfatase